MGLFSHKKPKGREDRQYLRAEASLRVNYQLGNESSVHYNCVVRDISEGGIRLSLYQRVAAGATLRLHLYLPDSEAPTLLFGKVVWERETTDRQFPYEAGIEFSLFEPSLRLRIQEYIRNKK